MHVIEAPITPADAGALAAECEERRNGHPPPGAAGRFDRASATVSVEAGFVAKADAFKAWLSLSDIAIAKFENEHGDVSLDYTDPAAVADKERILRYDDILVKLLDEIDSTAHEWVQDSAPAVVGN